MRLIDDFNDQKLSLDMTPLIDIIFLLVMFFAVSTSFISGDDLDKLKAELFTTGESNKVLSTELNSTKENYEKVFSQSVIDQTKIRNLEIDLENMRASNEGLSESLFEIQAETDRLTSKEELLTTLLLERQTENKNLSESEAELSRNELELARQLAMIQSLLDDKNSELANNQAENITETESLQEKLDSTTTAVRLLNEKLAAKQLELDQALGAKDSISAKEVLLQKLLAEKSAALAGMIVRLESADAARALAQKTEIENRKSEKASREQLLGELERSQTELLAVKSELEKFRNIADADRLQIERVLLAQKQLNEGMSSYLENNSLNITRDQQNLTLHLSDKILFASGSPTIKPGGLEVLKEIGGILEKKAGELEVQIGGHTDNVPIGGKTGTLADNWGLSAARSVNVVRFFESELNIEPDRMSAVGYGEYRPVSDNDTSEGRARNRRIEIVLVPR